MVYSLIRWWLCSLRVQWRETQSDLNSKSWGGQTFKFWAINHKFRKRDFAGVQCLPAGYRLSRDQDSSQCRLAGRDRRRSRWTQTPSPSKPLLNRFVLNKILMRISQCKHLMLQLCPWNRFMYQDFDIWHSGFSVPAFILKSICFRFGISFIIYFPPLPHTMTLNLTF